MDSLRLTRAKYEEMADEPSLDLLAAFEAIQEDVEKLTARAAREKWAPEKLIAEIDALLAPERPGDEVEAWA